MVEPINIRARPAGLPLVQQTWDKLLFLHWPIGVEQLRPLIPPRLGIDTFEGTAWIGMTPFTLWGTRPPFVPAVPLVSSSHELNVRTYVHLDGVPGVWFFSLDASNALAVCAARVAFHLPYFFARMSLEEDAGVRFESRRYHPGAPTAEFDAAWTWGPPMPPARLGTLDYFLIERYSLYAAEGDRLYRARIFHRPWPLRQAQLTSFSSTMLESHGLNVAEPKPLLHGQAAPLHVEIWRPRRV